MALDINEQSADKFTPLVMTIANGHLDVAKYLLDKVADPKPATVGGWPSRLYAVNRRPMGAARLVPAAQHGTGKK